MPSLLEITEYTDTFLAIHRFKDYAPNGLQVEGKSEVKKIVTGVTASQALLDAACSKHADAILVHHGYFWANEDARVVGMKRKRLTTLLQNEISLLAYHLPLDAHAQVGNNAQLALLLEIQIDGALGTDDRSACGNYGRLMQPISAEGFKHLIDSKLERICTHIAPGNFSASDSAHSMINSIAWCTGAGQNFIQMAVEQNFDAFISGEISEQTTHIAREAGIHYFAAGHHATERYGIRALGEHLEYKFGLQHEFIDIDNPA